ncbi:hypothetical protein [Paradevosia shaoguanensis]|uniref:hypothetical protein n=1 Tax=Paradevosia shaoguanensis TaxID=1335043 RepID=UPI001933627B|nr:hypothetical protein [Paradevosia shaoguanensis]
MSKQTAMRALDALEDHGFVVCTKRGGFNQGNRQSAEWLLTEFPDDRPGASPIAAKDFVRWKKSEASSTSKPARVSRRNRTGSQTEQSPFVTMGYGSTSKPVQRTDGSTSKPLLVYQGEGAETSSTGHATAVSVNGSQMEPLSDGERSLLRWLVGFGIEATHRKAQQNLSGHLGGEAIALAAVDLERRGLIRIDQVGRSRKYILQSKAIGTPLLDDPDQPVFDTWLAKAAPLHTREGTP